PSIVAARSEIAAKHTSNFPREDMYHSLTCCRRADEGSLPMKLYHCKGSRSTRVLWLLEELGLDYELEVLPFDPKALQSADFLQLHPFGKVPVLVDDTVTMFESVAIIQYLLEHYDDGRLRPTHESPH